MKAIYYIPVLFTFLLLSSCSVERFIPEDERLYRGAEITIDADSTITNRASLKAELNNVLRPNPNTKILGSYVGLYYHYKAQKEKPGFITKFLNKKIGEEPVYQSDVEKFEVEKLLLNRLENRGFFYSRATSDFKEDDDAKTASVDYTVTVPEPYRMETYQLDTLSPPIYREMKSTVRNSKFKKGMRFDLANLKKERDRMDYDLKREGYYNFNPSFLIFEVDTNSYDNKRFDLYLKLKKDVPKKVIVPYKLNKVRVYVDYDLEQDTTLVGGERFKDKTYYDRDNFFKLKHLDPFIKLEEGQLYNPDTSRDTARRLSTIGAYKFVNIQYKELDTLRNDSIGILEANIFLSPLNKRSVRAQLQAVTKSNNFAGPGLALTYSNRNLFRGGEILNISGTLGYEQQFGGGNRSGLRSIELGLKTELIFPRMLVPFKVNNNFFEYNIPKTITGVSFDYLNRSRLYTLLSGSARFGYVWDANKFITHELNPLSVNYTRLSDTTDEFNEILQNNSFLSRSFDQQFISGLTYSFIYNEMRVTNKKHQIYVNTTLDVAGNTISLLGQAEEGQEEETFLGLTYAQYAKVDVDFRYHFNFGKEKKIATRLFAGYGYAYGNSDVLPYTKQYFSGGPYSVRAFRIRSLGPGTLSTTGDEGTFFDQIGNIRLEANAEYRFPLFSYLKGAVFVDAGNIWNSGEIIQNGQEIADNPDTVPVTQKGRFSSDFINELGIGAGFGLRVDVQGFVIRFDLAAPFHDPSLPMGERWDFRYDEPIFNFAIGYPF